jgi:hypothetical protein
VWEGSEPAAGEAKRVVYGRVNEMGQDAEAGEGDEGGSTHLFLQPASLGARLMADAEPGGPPVLAVQRAFTASPEIDRAEEHEQENEP